MSTQTLGLAPWTLALVSELPPEALSRLNPDLLLTDLAPQLPEPLLGAQHLLSLLQSSDTPKGHSRPIKTYPQEHKPESPPFFQCLPTSGPLHGPLFLPGAPFCLQGKPLNISHRKDPQWEKDQETFLHTSKQTLQGLSQAF